MLIYCKVSPHLCEICVSGEASLYEELGVDSSASDKEIKPLGDQTKAWMSHWLKGVLEDSHIFWYMLYALVLYNYCVMVKTY